MSMGSAVDYDFSGKTCVVTGAGRGLGRATAREFARAGGNVAYVSRTAYPDVLSEVESNGSRSLFIRSDVSQSAEVSEAFRRVHDEFGSVDILINNAGIAKGGRIEDVSVEVWDDVMAQNVRSCFGP